jgi:D-3-phosphoglycerate dehydrogenase
MELKKSRLLVTPTSYGKNDPRLKTELEKLVGEVIYNLSGKPLSSEELASLLPGVDGYVAGLDQIDRNALKTADRLKVIARYGVGIDCVDLEAAREKGIVVTNTPGANSVSVAEMTVALILSLARNIPEAVTATRAGGWPRMNGISLENKTIGLLGFGSIGKQVARLLSGFNCRLIAYDPYPDLAYAEKFLVKMLSFDEIIAQSDFLSLHLPLNSETRGLVNDVFLDKIKTGSFIINTARGELIDDAALVAAISQGRIKGAALDVFACEPPGSDNPLLKMPQVLVTPHISSHTDGATDAMGWMAFNDCLAVLRGEAPAHQVF